MVVRERLKIVSWNICSVNKKLQQLLDLAQQQQPHIILLQETFLKPHNKSPEVPGYTWVRQDRVADKRGGVAMLLHSTVQYLEQPKPPDLKHAEIASCLVNTAEGKILVASLYLPPSKARKGEIGKILKLHPYFIIAGDLNAHWEAWGSSKSNDAGNYIDSWVNDLGINIFIPTSPTRIHPKDRTKDAVLDYALTHSNLQEVQLQVLPLLDSDHCPLSIQPLNLNLFTTPNFKIIRNWEQIRAEIESNEWPNTPIDSPEDIEEAASHIISTLQATLINNSHCIKIAAHQKRLLPKHVRELKKEKQKLLKHFKRTRSSNIKL